MRDISKASLGSTQQNSECSCGLHITVGKLSSSVENICHSISKLPSLTYSESKYFTSEADNLTPVSSLTSRSIACSILSLSYFFPAGNPHAQPFALSGCRRRRRNLFSYSRKHPTISNRLLKSVGFSLDII